MKMKGLVLLSLSLAVALALPPFPPGVAQSPSLTKEKQSPLLGDWVPMQGHVEVEHPGPQVRLVFQEQQEKMAPLPVDMGELKIKEKADVKTAPGVDLDPEVRKDLEVNKKPEVKADTDVKVEPEDEVKPDVQEETDSEEKPEFNEEQEVQEEFPTLMNLEEETEAGQDVQEGHIDMERTYEMADEPIMELEPLNNHISPESFQSEDPVGEPLPEVKGLMRKRGNGLDEEPVMELESEVRREPFLNQDDMPQAAAMEEGPALDFAGDPIQPLEHYFPNEEARMEGGVDETDTFNMEKWSEESSMVDVPQFAVEDGPVHDGDAQFVERRYLTRRDNKQATGQGYCPGEVLEGKCYQFFRGPKRAADAEFFCQEQFPEGHLASITSQYIHKKLMAMMLQMNGAYTRTWIGGLRYLTTGRFIWLDGSKWGYADWLAGEPNNTSDVEDCLEVLASGKFNDFTCWEPQAFICSYSLQ